MRRTLKRLSRRNEPYIFLVLLALCVLIEIRSGQFFTPNNIVDQLSALVVPGIFAVGTFMVIVSGGMDVSFPALASLSAYATTKLLLDAGYTGGIWLPILISIALGALLGAFNGLFVGYFGLPALIVTLGSSSVFKGFMQGTLESRQLAFIPEGMAEFGRSALFVATNPESGLTSRMPTSFVVFAAVLVAAWFILNRTMFGRGIYAIGGDGNAARIAGFNVRRIRTFVYLFSGCVTGIAAMAYCILMRTANPKNLMGSEMMVIAAVVVGGTRITGGHGGVIGTVLGVLLITLIQNNLIMLGVPTYWQKFVVGLVIVMGTSITSLRAKRIAQGRKV